MTLSIALAVVLVLALFAAIIYGLTQANRRKEKDEWRARRESNPERWRMESDGGKEVRR